MRVRRLGVMLGLLLGLRPVQAQATVPGSVEVLQPIDNGNVVRVSRVTYVGYVEDDAGGAVTSVQMTCDSNLVPSHLGPGNRNIAFVAGLKVRVVSRVPETFELTLRRP